MTNQQAKNIREAEIFGRYLINQKINSTSCNLYIQAIEIHSLCCDGKEKKIEEFILRFPFWIGFVDAAFALTNKQSVFRKKIFVMLAILECIPEYTSYFLPKKHSFLYIFIIIGVAFRSIYRFILGYLIIKLFKKS